MATPQIPPLDTVADKIMVNFMADPLASLANADQITTVMLDLLPAAPWEFPFPVPRVIYDRLKLGDLKDAWSAQL